jgi:hypothetical protein
MDGCVKIRRVFNNQRIVAAHLKGQDLLRLPGKLAMQLETGIGAAGKEQTVNAFQGT